jgi:secondary thiamine-phosphate synthase enzyme
MMDVPATARQQTAISIMVFQDSFTVTTRGRGTISITMELQERVRRSGIRTGICNIFLRHTSASLIVCENADPEVRSDLERYMARLVPDGDPLFRHTAEGPDDMPAHIRNILTTSEMTLPVRNQRCDLGTWQGIFLWEHRRAAHRRRLTITVYGE